MTKYLTFIALALMISASVEASGGYDRHGRGHAYGHQKHHHHHHRHDHYYGHRYRPVERVYYREQVVRYAPPPPPVYYQRPYAAYPVQRYDNRSVEGRVGAAFGGVVGYELGRGDPLTTGIGAAVGSFIGHEIRR